MAMTSYLDFAENDYKYFMTSYEHGIVANAMAADAQEICEKYMKHVIDKYFEPETEEEQTEYDIHMRTHNLNKLMRFLDQRMGLKFDREVKAEMQIINGYYFTARYPGDESIEVTKEDLDMCAEAVEHCRESILKMIHEIESELDENEKS